MKYTILIILAFFFTINLSFGQDEQYYEPTQADWDFYQTRVRTTIPPYGLEKVQRLMKTIKEKYSDEDDDGLHALTDEQFKSLSFREKFTYSMINPEVYSQNCDVYIPIPNANKKVFGYIVNWSGDSYWSERQENYFLNNRDSVMSLIKESTLRSKKMGANYKEALVGINGWEMIPFIIDYYTANPNDKDALTVLFLLMKKGEYVEFLKSSSYRKLYGPDVYYNNSMIDFNEANEKLIFERAMGYYKKRQETN